MLWNGRDAVSTPRSHRDAQISRPHEIRGAGLHRSPERARGHRDAYPRGRGGPARIGVSRAREIDPEEHGLRLARHTAPFRGSAAGHSHRSPPRCSLCRCSPCEEDDSHEYGGNGTRRDLGIRTTSGASTASTTSGPASRICYETHRCRSMPSSTAMYPKRSTPFSVRRRDPSLSGS